MDKEKEYDLIQGVKAVMAMYRITLSELSSRIEKKNGTGHISRHHLHDIFSEYGRSTFSSYWPQMLTAVNDVIRCRGFHLQLSEQDIIEIANRADRMTHHLSRI